VDENGASPPRLEVPQPHEGRFVAERLGGLLSFCYREVA